MLIKNKIFFVFCFILNLCFIDSIIHADEFDISAVEVIVDKNNNTVIGKGSVEAKDSVGNVINADEIMLTNNVIFKSNKFKIYGDNVIFNKNNLVATSKEKSKFISKNALIDSIGFDIIANGNIINFKGKTKLTLK